MPYGSATLPVDRDQPEFRRTTETMDDAKPDTLPAREPRISTGVPGLDDVLCGGLTPSRLYLL